MAASSPGGYGGAVAPGCGVFQQRHETHSVDVVAFRQPAELVQGRVDIEQADGAVAGLSGFCHPWRQDDERDSGGFFEEGEFFPVLLLSDVHAVVGPEHDDSVLRVWARVKRVKQSADLGIGVADRGQVATDRRAPFIVLLNPPVPAFSKRPVPGRRNVFEVAFFDRGKEDLLFRIEVEIFFWRVPRYVWAKDAHGVEEGLVAFLCQFCRGPTDDLIVRGS